MPVRILKSKKEVPKIKTCYLEAAGYLTKQIFDNTQIFLDKLLEVFSIQKPKNIIKDFFFLTYITALIHNSLCQKQANSKNDDEE